MAATHVRAAALVLVGLALTATPSFADRGRHEHDRRNDRRDDRRDYDRNRTFNRQFARPDVVVRRAVPRAFAPRFVRPSIVNVVPYRPYFYSYRPGFSFDFYYGRSYYGSGYGRYPYGYPAPPAGYLSAIPGRPYGGVRIEDAPRDAQVFADGYYMGIVDDFDGVFQHMNLEAGPHRIEVRAPGYEPIAFDVRVEPGETITYRADMLPLQR